MSREELLTKLDATKTMPELDALRMDTAQAMNNATAEEFDRVQGAFRKAKNRLQRIPWSQRKNW